MDEVTLDQVLEDIRCRLHLNKETENELLEEIRGHLEDAISQARARGEDDQAALLRAAEKFGVSEASAELQEIHSNWDAVDALAAAGLPVLFAVILRWLAFAPDGSALNWPQLLARPGFWTVAAAALVLPFVLLRRWRFALIGWGFFWILTVIFVIFPSINHW